MPPALMVPERRLEVLVEQALTAQLSAAMFHNRATAAVSLLTDYRAGTEHIPTRTVQVGAATSGSAHGRGPQDCWAGHCRRSLLPVRGMALAELSAEVHRTAEQDTAADHRCLCAAWLQCDFMVVLLGRQVLQEHNDEVWHVAFSPDGTQLASSSKDGTACVWQVGPVICTHAHVPSSLVATSPHEAASKS